MATLSAEEVEHVLCCRNNAAEQGQSLGTLTETSLQGLKDCNMDAH